VGRALYRHHARGQITGDLAGQIKLMFGYPDKTLLGVHIIGESAAELVHIGAMVLPFRRQYRPQYPTVSDGLRRLGNPAASLPAAECVTTQRPRAEE
jgi:pyruvate/2-oxoglutarate dehydrogenase complex dihydrolipoamide dehydrogenase (E3) component